MEAGLSDAQQRVFDTAREFAHEELAPTAAAREAAAEYPYGVLNRLAELGLMGIPFPEEYGGAGLDERTLGLVVAELAAADPAVAITVVSHTWLGAMPIHLWGTEEQRAYWMPQLCSGARVASLAFGDPLEEAEIPPAARLEDRVWALAGSNRTSISAGCIGFACLIVAATTSATQGHPETSLLIVPAETPGLTPGAEAGIEGFGAADVRPVTLLDCRVGEANLLGERGSATAAVRQLLGGSRLGMAALALSAAQAAQGPARLAESERARGLLLSAAAAPPSPPEPQPRPGPASPAAAPTLPDPDPAPATAASEPAPLERPLPPLPGPPSAAGGHRLLRKPILSGPPRDRAVAVAGVATGALAGILLLANWQL